MAGDLYAMWQHDREQEEGRKKNLFENIEGQLTNYGLWQKYQGEDVMFLPVKETADRGKYGKISFFKYRVYETCKESESSSLTIDKINELPVSVPQPEVPGLKSKFDDDILTKTDNKNFKKKMFFVDKDFKNSSINNKVYSLIFFDDDFECHINKYKDYAVIQILGYWQKEQNGVLGIFNKYEAKFKCYDKQPAAQRLKYKETVNFLNKTFQVYDLENKKQERGYTDWLNSQYNCTVYQDEGLKLK